MRKLLVGILIAASAGCVKVEEHQEDDRGWTLVGNDSGWGATGYKVVEIEGHSYIVMRVTGAYRRYTPNPARAAPGDEGRTNSSALIF